MADSGTGGKGDGERRWTVGSLSGVPVGAPVPTGSGAGGAAGSGRTGNGVAPAPEVAEGTGWVIDNGEISASGSGPEFLPNDVEAMTYNNPFSQNLERVWFDDKIVFALDVGEVDVDPAEVKVAQEYQIVYEVELDERGKLKRKREVEGQYNIYDSVPGMDIYSAIWQFNYVVVPQSYQPNSLRSAAACESSGHRIVRSNVFEN